MPRTRAHHLKWAKQLAFEVLDKKGPIAALEHFERSLKLHDETRNHSNWGLGMQLQMMQKLNTKAEVKAFINSFV